MAVITKMSKCASASCAGKTFYPNEMHPISISGKDFKLCPRCHQKIMDDLADKSFMGSMVKTTFTLEEINRIRRENAYNYATSGIHR